jgi:hypothetical protein
VASVLKLRFDRFGEHHLRAVARRQERTLDAVLVDALAHLDAGLQGRRCAAAPPRFIAGRSSAELVMHLAPPSSRLERLRDEARRRQVPLERLLEHALLMYLADLDSGRIEGAGPEALRAPDGRCRPDDR